MTHNDRESQNNTSQTVIDRIKFGVLSEYEETGTVDLVSWVSRYPDLRAEIIDFWLFVKGTPRTDEPPAGPYPAIDSDIAERALRDACLAINLGDQWLEPPFGSHKQSIDELARRMEALRAEPRGKVGRAPLAFRKAVIWSWVVSVFEGKRRQVYRITVQKTTYMLEASMELGVFTEYQRHSLGPYDHGARYRDAEPIAIKKKWLEIEGTSVRTGSQLSDAMRYAPRYLRSEDTAQQLVSYLAGFSDAQLETLATVHWSARNLARQAHAISVDEVRGVLGETAEWRSKLERPNFSQNSIRWALRILGGLRLVRET